MQKLTLACFGIAGCVWFNVTTAAEPGGLEGYLRQQTDREQAAQSAAKKRKVEDARTERIRRQRAENAHQQELARQQQIEQERAAEAARQEKEAEARRKAEWEAKLGMQMVSISAGSYVMGCQSGRDSGCDSDESPAHTVSLAAFELGKTEVTQGQWKAVMGNNPSYFKNCGDNCPVEQVSWDDIQIFIQKLNAQTGKTYRLPSEAEWEYVYRAGTNSSFYTGNCINTSQANYDGNYDFNNCGAKTGVYKQKTVAVGSYPANPWGLHDMAGNVREWVQDTWHANYQGAPSDGSAWEGSRADARVLRGGSWLSIPPNVRAADRSLNTPSGRGINAGFRLARTLP